MADDEQVYFRSDGRVYPVVEQDQISLRDMISFPLDAATVLGYPFSWKDYEALSEELEGLSEKEREAHPLGPFALSVLIWSSRRAAGDTISFGDCLDAPFEWVEVKRPQDRKPGKSKGPKRAPAKKTSRPKASAQPVEHPLDEGQAGT